MPTTNTGSVYQRKDGRWCASLIVNGTRKAIYAKTEKEARKKLLDLHKQVATYGDLPSPGRRTVKDLLDEHIKNVAPNLKPRTIESYRATARRYILPAIGNVRLSNLTPTHLQNLYSDLQARGLHDGVRHTHAVLHRALRLATFWGWLVTNPADRVLPPTYHPARKEVWTTEELAAFLEGTQDDWLHPLWLTLICSGCRIGEMLALRWNDVNLTNGTLTIRRSVQRICHEWVETTPKTRAGERTLTLPSDGIATLRRQKAKQAEWRLQVGANWQDDGRVFTTQEGKPVYPYLVSHNIKARCKKLGVRDVSPHGLRHLHASLLLGYGLPLPAVSQRLGHANTGITASVYAHALKRQDEEAARAIGDALKGGDAMRV